MHEENAALMAEFKNIAAANHKLVFLDASFKRHNL